MVGQVVGDHSEVLLESGILEQVPPLPPVRPGGVLQEQSHVAGSRLLEVDAVLDVVEGQIDVAANRIVETRIIRHCSPPA